MTAELELISSGRILSGTRADITVRVTRDGELATPTGTLTYTVVDADGDTVATGTPTAANGEITFVLTAAQATIGTLTVTWGGLVFDAEPAISLETTVEVIGAWLFTIEDTREAKIPQATYSDDVVLVHRDRVTAEFERHLGFPLGVRYFRDTLSGDNTATLILPQMKCTAIRAIETRSVDTWTALTEAELARCFLTGNGVLTRENSYWPRGVSNIRVGYEAGLQPIPLDLRMVGVVYLRHLLMNDGSQEQATAVNKQGGTYTLAKPGDVGYFTGLPSVDRVLASYRKKLPGIA